MVRRLVEKRKDMSMWSPQENDDYFGEPQEEDRDPPAPRVTGATELLPCPFCGGPVKLEKAHVRRDYIEGDRQFYGVVCRNTTNRGGSCCMEQVPSASEEAAVARWNMRNGLVTPNVRAKPGATVLRCDSA
jgi:hypothetical protein